MKNLLPKLSLNCVITAVVCIVALAILPLKLVLIIGVGYWVARTAGATAALQPVKE